MKYIDIHSHLGFEDYGKDLKEVIDRMQKEGVATISVGADFSSSADAVKVASENENVWACIGLHPAEKRDETFDEEKYEELLKSPKVVAIGECGLDYYSLKSQVESLKHDEGGEKIQDSSFENEKERQIQIFKKQIELAIKYDKPLMLHIRNGADYKTAFEDAFSILESYKISPESRLRGNIHFFTGKLAQAQKFIDLGFTISFTGLITYIQDFNKTIKAVPLDKIHAETDAPYVAPVPHRGERNEPTYVIEIVKKIAEIRGEDFEKVRLQLLENTKKLFDISI